MPGLLRGMARTAVVAGTATAVSNNVSRRQAQRWSNQQAEADMQAQQQAAQAQPAPAQNDEYAEIERLAQLKANGVITEDEFQAKKRQILGI